MTPILRPNERVVPGRWLADHFDGESGRQRLVGSQDAEAQGKRVLKGSGVVLSSSATVHLEGKG